MSTVMARPPESEQATLTVSIDVTEGDRDPKIEAEKVLCPTEARRHFGFFNTWNGMPLSNTARLFNGNRPDPRGHCELSMDGFSIAQLEDENDRWWNLKTKSAEPGLLVNALTEDGKGGFLNWEANQPNPCLLYIIENIFNKTIKALKLETPPAANNARLHPGIYKGQNQNLQEWFTTDYTPRVAACFTHRPITESYFLDLQYADIPQFQKDSRGRALFGQVNYEILKKVRSQIEDRHL